MPVADLPQLLVEGLFRERTPDGSFSLFGRLSDKTDRYAKDIGVTPSGIIVRNFKSRWGSCDSRGQLFFNWNIIKIPHAVSEYLGVHELCHLVHPNHSKDFWALVGRFNPTYADHIDWLKHQGRSLLTH